jgi:hypothetical protein
MGLRNEKESNGIKTERKRKEGMIFSRNDRK